MKHVKKIAIALAGVIMVLTLTFFIGISGVQAADTNESGAVVSEAVQVAQAQTVGTKALGAALVVGIAACGGAIAMGIAIAKANEGTARQPEASSRIQTMLMLGLVFIETVVIYALIVAILIIFVM